MKHIENYFILSFSEYGGENLYNSIAILNSLRGDNLKTIISNLFEDWGYEDEDSKDLINEICNMLRLSYHFDDDNYDIHFRIECVPYYE